MTYSFANEHNKIAKIIKCGIDLRHFAHISVQEKIGLR